MRRTVTCSYRASVPSVNEHALQISRSVAQHHLIASRETGRRASRSYATAEALKRKASARKSPTPSESKPTTQQKQSGQAQPTSETATTHIPRTVPSAEDQKKLVLNSALKFIPQYGWTVEALSKGAEDCQHPGMVAATFPRGPVELVEYWLDQCDDKIKEKVKQLDLESMNMKERVKAVLKARLELFTPFATTWHQALGLLMNPANLQRSLNRYGDTIGMLMYLIGDTVNDLDWYSKRALIGAAYAAAELYMLTDRSHNFHNTREFIDRRVDEIAALSHCKAEFNDLLGCASGFATTMMSQQTPSNPPQASQPGYPPPISSATTSTPNSGAAGTADNLVSTVFQTAQPLVNPLSAASIVVGTVSRLMGLMRPTAAATSAATQPQGQSESVVTTAASAAFEAAGELDSAASQADNPEDPREGPTVALPGGVSPA